MADPVDAAAKKLKEAEREIQAVTAELRQADQAQQQRVASGAKEASSTLTVTLDDVAGDNPTPPALHLSIDPEAACTGNSAQKISAASADTHTRTFAIKDLKAATLKVRVGNATAASEGAAAGFALADVAVEKDASKGVSVAASGSTYTLKLKLALSPAAKVTALRRKLDKLYKQKKTCEEKLQGLVKAGVMTRPTARQGAAARGGAVSPSGRAAGGGRFAASAAETGWKRYLSLATYPKSMAFGQIAFQLVTTHKNIFLFFGGVTMMHLKGDELAC